MEQWLLSIPDKFRAMFYMLHEEHGLAVSEARKQVVDAINLEKLQEKDNVQRYGG